MASAPEVLAPFVGGPDELVLKCDRLLPLAADTALALYVSSTVSALLAKVATVE